MSVPIDRRFVLRAAGAALALPWLEAMVPTWASRASGAPAPKAPPLRLGFVYVPNGVHMPAWTPTTEGAAYELPAILGPLAPHRDRLLVLSGLAHAKAERERRRPRRPRALRGDLPDRRAGRRRRRAPTSAAGVSVDQVAAQIVGTETASPRSNSAATRARHRATATRATPARTRATSRGGRRRRRTRRRSTRRPCSTACSATRRPGRPRSARRGGAGGASILDLVLGQADALRRSSARATGARSRSTWRACVRSRRGSRVRARPRRRRRAPRLRLRRPIRRPSAARPTSRRTSPST